MKFTRFFLVFGMLLCLSSCSKDRIDPYTPTEWQYDKYSDTGILPGDDFYRFVCGKGIASEGSDSWAPHPSWAKQEKDFSDWATSNGDDNPVPIIKRINELKKASVSEELMSSAFVRMRERLNAIGERTKGKEFPEKAAEYFRDGYLFFSARPVEIDGHKFKITVLHSLDDVLTDWTPQQLELAGIKDKYNELLPKARMFENYLLDNIKDGGKSIEKLDAGSSAFERFATALGNKNPDFVPANDGTRQFFELVDKMDGTEMKEAADAFLWCVAVSLDMHCILNNTDQKYNNYILTLQYPNLLINMSHTFCEMYVKPECETKNRDIFETLRRTMIERIEQSEWLSPRTKAGARKKLDAMECHTGILDWAKYEAEMPVADDFCSALHEIGSSYATKLMAISGENSSLDHIVAAEYMTPLVGAQAYTGNSLYLLGANAMCILPSTSLWLDMNAEFPFQMYLIGHEMCHGFDAAGANYNERGELEDWWSVNDRLVFKEKQNQLIGIFNQYHVSGATFCNGAKTIDEDMADLGGLEIAYYATVKELEQKFGGEELLEMKRKFFKSYAIWRAMYTSNDEKIKQVEGSDVHSLQEFRTNGIVNHIDDWYQLFDVTPERKFYLSPERRVYLW